MAGTFHITCSDGHNMLVYFWKTGSEISAIIAVVNGMSEYGMRYAPVAEILNAKGFAVFAHDNRGHGDATDIPGYAGKDFFYKQIEDVRLLVHYLREHYPNKKIFIMGHSMGSFIAQRYFQL